jgi:hypothetical protein
VQFFLTVQLIKNGQQEILNHIQVALVFSLNYPVGTALNDRENDSDLRIRNGLEGIVHSPNINDYFSIFDMYISLAPLISCDLENLAHGEKSRVFSRTTIS